MKFQKINLIILIIAVCFITYIVSIGKYSKGLEVGPHNSIVVNDYDKISENLYQELDISDWIVRDEFVTNSIENDFLIEKIKDTYPVSKEIAQPNYYSFRDDIIDYGTSYSDGVDEFHFWHISQEVDVLMAATIQSNNFLLGGKVKIGMNKEQFKSMLDINEDKNQYTIGTFGGAYIFVFLFDNDILTKIVYMDTYTH